MDLQKTIKSLIKYSIEELLNWILATSIHPSNQRFCFNLELLFKLLISIQPIEFENQNITREDFIKIIRVFSEETQSVNHIVDSQDFKNQSELVPIFVNGKKYYFFYGAMSAPYKLAKWFYEKYIDNEDLEKHKELKDILNCFILSLEYQTKLLEVIKSINESGNISENEMHVPSQNFYDRLFAVLNTNRFTSMLPSDIQKYNLLQGENHLSDIWAELNADNILSSIVVQLNNGKLFFTLPQLHIESLHILACRLINESENKEELMKELNNNFCYKAEISSILFFNKNFQIKKITDFKSREINITADLAFLVDSNKVCLINVVDKTQKDILETKKNQIVAFEDELKKAKNINIFLENKKINQANPTKVEDLEIWKFYILNDLELNKGLELPSGINSTSVFIEHQNFKILMERLDSPLTLIKYFKTAIMSGKFKGFFDAFELDRFAYFISNDQEYPVSLIPKINLQVPLGYWEDFNHNEQIEKYKDNIYELIERDFPHRFDTVMKNHGNEYGVMKKVLQDGGYVIKNNNMLIWIMMPLDRFQRTPDETHYCISFVGKLYAYYLQKLQQEINSLLTKYNYDLNKSIIVEMLPTSIIEKNDSFKELRHLMKEIKDSDPFIYFASCTNSPQEQSINVKAIFSIEKLQTVFNGGNNSPEKLCIQGLIEEILNVLCKDKTKASEEAKIFVDKNIKVGKGKHVLKEFKTHNPSLDKYQKPIERSLIDVNNLNRELSKKLMDLKIKPGEYKNDEALKINKDIFNFLYEKLRNEIVQYDKSILFLAMKQAELVEGARKENDMQLEIDSSTEIEFDLVETTIKKNTEIARLAEPIKYIVSLIMKEGIKGIKKINREGWGVALAAADLIRDTSTIHDFLKYNLSEYTLKIDELYRVIDLKDEKIFDISKYYKKESKEMIQVAKDNFRYRFSGAKLDNAELSEELKDETDAVFNNEYGFKFKNMLNLLCSLGNSENFTEDYFPATLIKKEDIKKVLNRNNFKIEENELDAILKFLSINFNSFDDINILLLYELNRNSKRVNLSPLIELEKDTYIYGRQICLKSANFWLREIYQGSIPFSVGNMPKAIEDLSDRIHRFWDLELEEDACKKLKEILDDKNVECRISNFKRLSSSFVSRPPCGEIDVLAVNNKNKTIYVFDAKNLTKKIRPYDLRHEYKEFFEDKIKDGKITKPSYLTKLSKKEEFVKDNLPEVLNHFGIVDTNGWSVKKAFIVKENYTSAFSKEHTINFLLIEELKEYFS